MKKLLILIAVVVAIVLTIRLARPPKVKIVSAESKEQIQKVWSKSEVLKIGGPELRLAILDGIKANGAVLSSQQQQLLLEKITLWMRALRSGEFEEFMQFRAPDAYQFNTQQIAFVAAKVYGNPEALGGFPDLEKAKVLFSYFNKLRFESLSASSISIAVKRLQTEPKGEIASPFNYYPGGVLKLHSASPFRYLSNPAAIFSSDGEVLWAGCSFAFSTELRPGELVPVTLALYWCPRSQEWKPSECYLTSLHRPGDKGPNPLFYF